MRLTITWSYRREEGVLRPTDIAELKRQASESWGDRVHVLDFLKDAAFEVSKLYDEMREAVPGGTACQSSEQAVPETTSNDEQQS